MFLLIQNENSISVTHIVEEIQGKSIEVFIDELSSGNPYLLLEELPVLPIENYKIVDGALQEIEGSFASSEPPQWGYFATAMASCNDCRTWINSLSAISTFDAVSLMNAMNNANPSAELIQAILDNCMALVSPSEVLIEQWEDAAETYNIPLRFRPEE